MLQPSTAMADEDYVLMRSYGMPEEQIIEFSDHGEGVALLKIFNGGINGEMYPVTSAEISLNGETLLAPRDFRRHNDYVELTVDLDANNIIKASLRGRPGSGLTVRVVQDEPDDQGDHEGHDHSSILFWVENNAIRDHYPADGAPDEITPHSANYIYNNVREGDPNRSESRTFAEFRIYDLADHFVGATLSFTAFRYHPPDIGPLKIMVTGYIPGDGLVDFDDWYAADILVGESEEIPPFDADGSNRGVGMVLRMDISALLHAAADAGVTYLGLAFSYAQPNSVNPSNPLGYFDLITVGNYSITTY